jgi:hypothetical protein
MTTLSIMALSITTPSIMPLVLKTFGAMGHSISIKFHYAQCHYADILSYPSQME